MPDGDVRPVFGHADVRRFQDHRFRLYHIRLKVKVFDFTQPTTNSHKECAVRRATAESFAG